MLGHVISSLITIFAIVVLLYGLLRLLRLIGLYRPSYRIYEVPVESFLDGQALCRKYVVCYCLQINRPWSGMSYVIDFWALRDDANEIAFFNTSEDAELFLRGYRSGRTVRDKSPNMHKRTMVKSFPV